MKGHKKLMSMNGHSVRQQFFFGKLCRLGPKKRYIQEAHPRLAVANIVAINIYGWKIKYGSLRFSYGTIKERKTHTLPFRKWSNEIFASYHAVPTNVKLDLNYSSCNTHTVPFKEIETDGQVKAASSSQRAFWDWSHLVWFLFVHIRIGCVKILRRQNTCQGTHGERLPLQGGGYIFTVGFVFLPSSPECPVFSAGS